MTELKTEASLLSALEGAAKHTPTAEEIHKQRVSFIMASVSEKGNVTRTKIERVLAQHDGKK